MNLFVLEGDHQLYFKVLKYFLYTVFDLLTAYNLKSLNYLVISMVLPPAQSSLENLLVSLIDTNWVDNDLLYYLLCYTSIFYYPLSLQFVIDQLFISFTQHFISKDQHFNSKDPSRSYSHTNLYFGYFKHSLLSILLDSKAFPMLEIIENNLLVEYLKSYSKSHIPCLNITWFFFLHIFEQYSHIFFHYFYLVACFLINFTNGKNKFELITLFHFSTFKHWLLHICEDRDLIVYLLLFILYKYVEYLLFVEGLANPNFLNWISLGFVMVFLGKKYLKIKSLK